MGRITDYEGKTKEELVMITQKLRNALSAYDEVELPSLVEAQASDEDTLKTLLIICEADLMEKHHNLRLEITKLFTKIIQNR